MKKSYSILTCRQNTSKDAGRRIVMPKGQPELTAAGKEEMTCCLERCGTKKRLLFNRDTIIIEDDVI